jgi:hypothetical protein
VSTLAEYLDRRASHYEMEGRWPSAPFWARRRPGAWRDAPVTLDPAARLRRVAGVPTSALARAEALVPPRVVASALEAAEAPTPAHVLLSAMREKAPIGDRRLLIGLQTLLAIGALTRA